MRHYKPKAERKIHVIPIRLTADQYRQIEAFAKTQELGTSTWLRRVALLAIKADMLEE